MSNRLGRGSDRSSAARRTPSRRRKTFRIYNQTAHRLREIEHIIRHRHGVVPDTDDAGIYLEQVAQCLARMLWNKSGKAEFDSLMERLTFWCERWAPEVSIKIQQDVAKAVIGRSRQDNADECAAKLRLSYAERTQLQITTIGAWDVNKRERDRRYKERKRARDRERAARKRAERGAMPRDAYLANSLSRTQPWKAEGISRRTWERRQAVALKPESTARAGNDVPVVPLGDGAARAADVAVEDLG